MALPGERWARWRVPLGYPLALLCWWLAWPVPESLVLGGAIGVLGLVLRAAAAGCLRKHAELATGGPYAYTRNPLYLGSFLLAAGFLVAGHAWLPVLPVAAYFAVFYTAVMRREERELRSLYGAAFDDYADRVPLFLPRLHPGKTNGAGFSWALYRRNREYQAALGFVAVMALLWLRMYLRG